MNKILKKLNILLDKKQKMQMAGLIVLMFIGALMEAFSIAGIVPVAYLVPGISVGALGVAGDLDKSCCQLSSWGTNPTGTG